MIQNDITLTREGENQRRKKLTERLKMGVQGAIGGTLDDVVKLEARATFTPHALDAKPPLARSGPLSVSPEAREGPRGSAVDLHE